MGRLHAGGFGGVGGRRGKKIKGLRRPSRPGGSGVGYGGAPYNRGSDRGPAGVHFFGLASKFKGRGPFKRISGDALIACFSLKTPR